jgi:hypothetical protein
MGEMLRLREVVEATVYLTVILVGAFAVGGWAADRWGGNDRLDRALAWVVAAIAHPLAVALALGAIGELKKWTVLVLCALTGAAAAFAWISERRSRADVPAERSVMLVAALGAVAGVSALLVGFSSGATLHHDSKYYHYGAIAHFVRTGSIWTLPFENPGFFTSTHPANAELLGAVVAFSTGGDHLLDGWLLPVSGLLTVLASAALAREVGGRASAGALAGIAVVTAPFVFGIVAHGLANDLFAVAGVVAASALLLRARREGTSDALWLAGIALGVAVGAKYTVLVPGIALVAATLLFIRPLRRAFALLPGVAAFAGPWFLRNAIDTGNPLYPQKVRAGGTELLSGGSGVFDRYSGTIGGHVLHWRTGALSSWVDLARVAYGPLLVTTPIGIALGVWLGIKRGNRALVALSAFGALALLTYAVTPYTGTSDPPLVLLLGSNQRYLMLTLVLALVALVGAVKAPFDLAIGGAVAAWCGWELWRHPLRHDVRLTPVIVAASLIVAVLVVLVLHTPTVIDRLRGQRLLVLAGVTAVVGLGLASTLVGPRRTLTTSPLEDAVARAARKQHQVAVFGVDDLRSVIGGSLAREPRSITPNDRTPVDVDQVNATLEASGLQLLVVGSGDGIPDGYRPPSDWCQLTEVSGFRIFRKAPAGTSCP